MFFLFRIHHLFLNCSQACILPSYICLTLIQRIRTKLVSNDWSHRLLTRVLHGIVLVVKEFTKIMGKFNNLNLPLEFRRIELREGYDETVYFHPHRETSSFPCMLPPVYCYSSENINLSGKFSPFLIIIINILPPWEINFPPLSSKMIRNLLRHCLYNTFQTLYQIEKSDQR